VITAWFIGIGTGFVDWFLGLFGTADPPAFIVQATDFVAGLLSSAAGLGAWIPWALVLAVAGFNFLLWATGFGVKAVRWCVGLIPSMGGGS
jgi:hypothetical protein